MKLKLKDIIAIALVAITSFPVLYFVMLFVTGTARIDFGPQKVDEGKKEKIVLMKQSAKKDSLLVSQSRAYQALQAERVELEKERERLRKQQGRIDLLQSEVETERKMMVEERKKMESLVDQSDSLGKKKIKDVSKVYAAMRPSEAATILGTMDEKMVATILQSINDDRQKAKIMSLFSPEKAARVSKIIGSP